MNFYKYISDNDKLVEMVVVIKSIAYILIAISIAIGLTSIGDGKAGQVEIHSDPIVHFDEVLKYTECYVADDSNLKGILTNLPGGEFLKDNSSTTNVRGDEINIFYNDFEEVEIKFENGMSYKYDIDWILEHNAAVIFVRCSNVNVINVYMENGNVYTYSAEEMRNDYYIESDGRSLNEVAQSVYTLINFYHFYII